MVFLATAALLRKKEDWETVVIEMLADFNLLENIKHFDKDNVSDKVQQRINVYLKKPNFNEEYMKKKSLSAS